MLKLLWQYIHWLEALSTPAAWAVFGLTAGTVVGTFILMNANGPLWVAVLMPSLIFTAPGFLFSMFELESRAGESQLSQKTQRR